MFVRWQTPNQTMTHAKYSLNPPPHHQRTAWAEKGYSPFTTQALNPNLVLLLQKRPDHDGRRAQDMTQVHELGNEKLVDSRKACSM